MPSFQRLDQTAATLITILTYYTCCRWQAPAKSTVHASSFHPHGPRVQNDCISLQKETEAQRGSDLLNVFVADQPYDWDSH